MRKPDKQNTIAHETPS